MADIKIDNDPQESAPPGVPVEFEYHMGANGRSEYNDLFSDIIFDSERIGLLKGRSPIIVDAIEKVLDKDDYREVARTVANDAIAFVNRGGSIPNVVRRFGEQLVGEKAEVLAPYVNGQNREYLAIFCSFIEAVRGLNKSNQELANKISGEFSQATQEIIRMSPDEQKDKRAIEIILNNLKKDPVR